MWDEMVMKVLLSPPNTWEVCTKIIYVMLELEAYCQPVCTSIKFMPGWQLHFHFLVYVSSRHITHIKTVMQQVDRSHIRSDVTLSFFLLTLQWWYYILCQIRIHPDQVSNQSILREQSRILPLSRLELDRVYRYH